MTNTKTHQSIKKQILKI